MINEEYDKEYLQGDRDQSFIYEEISFEKLFKANQIQSTNRFNYKKDIYTKVDIYYIPYGILPLFIKTNYQKTNTTQQSHHNIKIYIPQHSSHISLPPSLVFNKISKF